MSDSPSHLLVCRPSMEPALLDEAGDAGLSGKVIGAGVVLARGALPSAALVFERQRLPDARHLPPGALNPLSEESVRAMTRRLAEEPSLWALHPFALPEDAPGLPARADGVARNLERVLKRLDPVLARRQVEPARLARRGRGLALQLLLLPDGLWHSCAPLAELTDPHPGGVRRMRFDDAAPSRSYLKLEEAFERMGLPPAAGERAVDLGAAPGGWSYALAKRGCRVLAVDNGPLKIEAQTPGRIEHRRADGLSFEPDPADLPLDWLVADMLIPPGPAFGLLKRWLVPGRARRLVVNIKLPQEQPWPALRPIVRHLRALPGWTVSIRQLYHDRREVTVMAAAE